MQLLIKDKLITDKKEVGKYFNDFFTIIAEQMIKNKRKVKQMP